MFKCIYHYICNPGLRGRHPAPQRAAAAHAGRAVPGQEHAGRSRQARADTAAHLPAGHPGKLAREITLQVIIDIFTQH